MLRGDCLFLLPDAFAYLFLDQRPDAIEIGGEFRRPLPERVNDFETAGSGI